MSISYCLPKAARPWLRGVLAPPVLSWLLAGAPAALAQQRPELPPDLVEKADRLRQDLRQMTALARDRVFPALANISVITVRYWGGQEIKGKAVGSGTIISPEGYVLTNFHVAQNGKKFKVTLSDKQEITATLVGEDPLTDLAVLKLDLSELKNPKEQLPVAQFGDSEQLQVGDTVMAMGSPWALSRSVTLGIVSNTERILAGGDDDVGEMRFDENQRTGIFNRWIQHDAAISPGNSGGPLVNLKGEVVGVNTRGGMLGGDMGFAIPSNVAKAVAAALIAHGEVPRSALGLSFKPIKSTGRKTGVLVNSVEKDGPADAAGIRAGDVILEIDGERTDVMFPEEVPPLLKRLADYVVGSKVRIKYEREGKAAETALETVKFKRDAGDEAAFRAWGLACQDITERMARERRLDSTQGVFVTSVKQGSPAQLAEPPLDDGDVVRRIDGKTVNTLAEFIELYKQIMDRKDLPEYLLVEFDRAGKNQVTLLKPRPDKDPDPPREVAKAWIGVAVQPVLQKLAGQLGLGNKLGFRITRIYPGTLAAGSDLKVGDVIVALNGDPLRPRGMQEAGLFHRVVRQLDMDGSARLGLIRDGQERQVEVKLERTRLTPEEAARERNRDFDLTVREITFFDRDEARWGEDVKGVIVSQVEPAGWSGLGGVRSGDLIQRIADREVTDLDSFKKALAEVTQAKPERIEFVVLRGVRTHFQYVEPEWKPVATGEGKTEKGQDKE